MLHGWGQSLESLLPLAELLSNESEIHLLDLPGFGSSSAPESDWDTIAYAECIRKYLESNSIKKADLLGHSFGGRVSIRLASRYPEFVSSVILIDSGGLRKNLGRWKLKSQLVKTLGKSLKSLDKLFATRLFETWFVPRFASVDYKNAGKLRNILVKTVNEDISEDASKIKAPVFILWGELDNETPLEMCERLNGLITNSKLVTLPGKGHFPFQGLGALLCASHISQFLRSLSLAANGNSSLQQEQH